MVISWQLYPFSMIVSPLYVRIFDEVVSGKELWRSLEADKTFTELDRSVVRIGEETGRLVDALAFLTDYYQKRE